jgi:hypothetical protein
VSGERRCPFCGATTAEALCGACGRDVAAPRRPCRACAKMTPADAVACVHCGAVATSEWRWKLPLIIGMFVLAFIASVLLQMYR